MYRLMPLVLYPCGKKSFAKKSLESGKKCYFVWYIVNHDSNYIK